MQINDYRILKSGTDVRGVAVDGDFIAGAARLDEAAAYNIASAFVFWLQQKLGCQRLSLAVGNDSRISAPILVKAVTEAFRNSGSDYYLCGLTTTPAMFMMTKFDQTKCDGAIMITASHHPYYMNGMKFFTADGGISSKELDSVLICANEEKRIDAAGYKEYSGEYRSLYTELLKSQIRAFSGGGDTPLAGMKIVVDAGNGAAGFFAGDVLAPLGAEIRGSQFLEPDGYFPNHVPNPEDKVAIKSIKNCVLDNGADLGVIFDTDGDRVGIVTADGNEINRNRLIAAATALLLEQEENRGAHIVTDSVTSEGLKEFIVNKGGVHCRFKRGYKNVIEKAQQLCMEGKNALLAMETSGHAAFRENYFLDDGAYLAVRLIAKAIQLKKSGKSLAELISGLREPIEAVELRLTLSGNDWKETAQKIIADLTTFSEKEFVLAQDNFEGVRAVVAEANGWFLLRLSVHDPVLPLNIESDTAGGAKKIMRKLSEFFSKYEMLDCSKLHCELAKEI